MWNEWRAAISRHTPEPEQLLHAGKETLGPAAAAALIVFALVILALGRRAALAAGSLAMIAGFVVANYRKAEPLFPWWPKPLEDTISDPPRIIAPEAWKWIPLLFLVACFDGLFARVPSVPLWGGWRLRLGVGFMAAMLLVPMDLHKTWPVILDQTLLFRAMVWPLLAFTLTVALGWAGSEAVARQSPGGAVGLGMAIALFGASIVALHAHWGTAAEALTFPAAALLGISIVAFVRKSDVGGALPGACVMLPCMLMATWTENSSHAVPWYAFVLAAMPPVAIGLLAIPPMSRWTGITRWLLFWVLCLGPTIAAVVITVRAEAIVAASPSWEG
jgi:hypothetical protein